MGVFLEPSFLCMSRYARNSGWTGIACVKFEACGEHHLRGYHCDRDRCDGRTGVCWFQRSKPSPIGSMGLVYLPTFTINIKQMLANIPYMDCMGHVKPISTIFIHVGPVNGPTKSWILLKRDRLFHQKGKATCLVCSVFFCVRKKNGRRKMDQKQNHQKFLHNFWRRKKT